MDVRLGQVVYSKAGRDASRKLVIIGVVDEANVLVADGNLRRMERPKKKKIKHLELTQEIIQPLSEKLHKQLKVTNSDIRKFLGAQN